MWNKLFKDRRNSSQRALGFISLTGLITWLLLSAAVGQTLPDSAGKNVSVVYLVEFQWWVIAGLIGVIGALISFLAVREFNSSRSNIRELWNKKLDKDQHDDIDHSRLCPVCRDIHVGDRGK